MSRVCLLIRFVVLLAVPAAAWKFKILGLDEDRILITRIAVYGVRAFLAVPRLYNEQPYTLIEVPWPERSLYTIYSPKAFPSGQAQTIGDCKKVQSVVTMDIDFKGRMYVLDRGIEGLCSPKIVVYDLKSNKEILQTDLKGVPPDNLSSLVVDPNLFTQDAGVIVSDAGNNSLLIFNLLKNSWWRLSITHPSKSVDHPYVDESEEISFDELAVSQVNGVLYATSSRRHELYSIDLQELRKMEDPVPLQCNSSDYNASEIAVRYVGDKFGKSAGLFVDVRGNLYYVYERDNVILKWNPTTPFVTENQNVVLQSFPLIKYPVQIFAEPSYQLWALNSKRNQESTFVVKIKT